jgi:uncharacterized membrane protein YczE
MGLFSTVLILIGVAAVFVGFMLIRGHWRIPDEKKEKVTIGSIILAIVVGICSLLFTANPGWLQSLQAKLTRKV